MAFKNISNQVDFPAMEQEILDFWQQQGIFEKSLEQRKGAQEFVEDLLKRTDEDLAKHASEVHQTRQMLRKPAAKEE